MDNELKSEEGIHTLFKPIFLPRSQATART